MGQLKGNQVGLIIAYIVFNLLGTAATGLRFYAIFISRRKVRGHDILCAVALVMLGAYSIDTLVGAVYGIGLRIRHVTDSQLAIALKTFFVSQFFSAISIMTYRLAILDVYMSIFTTRTFNRAASVCMVIVVLVCITNMATTLGLCRPVQTTWDKTVSGVCGNQDAAEISKVVVDGVIDLVVVLLPLRSIWTLQMATEKMVQVIITLGLVLNISGVNLSRLIKLVDCSLNKDFTRCALDDLILTNAEMTIGIIIACIPTLAPVLPRHWQSSSDTNGSARLDSNNSNNSNNSIINNNDNNNTKPNRPANIRLPSNNTYTSIMTSARDKVRLPSYSSIVSSTRDKIRLSSQTPIIPSPQPRRSSTTQLAATSRLRHYPDSPRTPPRPRPLYPKAHLHSRNISHPMPVRPYLLGMHRSFDAELYDQVENSGYDDRMRRLQSHVTFATVQ